jgi:malonyl-CoA O-methyltransferase
LPAPAPGWLDHAAARRAADRAARRGPFPDPLGVEIGRRMLERLDYVKLAPRRILVLGGDGEALRARYPTAQVLAVGDPPTGPGVRQRLPWRARIGSLFAARRRETLIASIGRLPIAADSCDLVWSNLALARTDEPATVLREWSRAAATEGLLMFSSLGPDTLKELRAAFADDPRPHVHPFVDMHDLGDMLVAAGFADPVMDMEIVTLTYARVDDLIADLRASGDVNSLAARRRGLTGRRVWDRVRRAYAEHAREGRLPASFEVVYGHAWKPRPRVAADGRQIIKFDRAPRPRQPD